jgi:hypothetical protein
MTRFTWLTVAVLGGLLGTPAAAPAQFFGGVGVVGFPRPPLGGGLTPQIPNIAFAQQYRFGLNTPFGSYNVGRTIYGPAGYYWLASQGGYRGSYLYPSVGTGYITGGVANPALAAAQANLTRAQLAAGAAMSAKGAVHEQWAYEKIGVPGVKGVKLGADTPEAVAKALATTDEREIATGEPLNHLLVAASVAEKKAGKVESAFLPPDLLADLVFTGPKADAVNLLRRGGRLDFPAGFDAPALADARAVLEREFAAVASPVLLGKAAEPARATKLEAAVAEARKALAPQVREMSFEDATAARRFLNQLDGAARTFKAPGTAGLIDPAWRVEGTNAAGLVKHLTRHNLLFAPAAAGTEDRYAATHRGLATYLYALTEAQKK